MKTQWTYGLLPIPNLTGNHPIACLGKPNRSEKGRATYVHVGTCKNWVGGGGREEAHSLCGCAPSYVHMHMHATVTLIPV